MTKLIYTCLFNDYDEPKPLTVRSGGFNHVIFTDNPELKCEGWEIQVLEKESCPKKQSRKVKLLIHQYYEADLYVYIDASYQIKADLNTYVQKFFKGGYLAQKHYKRRCIFQEAAEVLKLGRETKEVIDNQMTDYQSKQMPRNWGLYENGFIIRDKSFNDFCELWYKEIEKHSYRDQLSFPYVLFRTRQKITAIPSYYKNSYLKLHLHKSKPLKRKPKVWYFTPACGKKDLGTAYNDHCNLVPDDDWICIRDLDTMFLYPFAPKQIEDVIQKHGNEYSMFSCLTNRLGLSWQTPYGISDNADVVDHYNIAEKHFKEYYDVVEPSPRPTAGLFMLFKKEVWNEIKFAKGITGNGKFIDWRFSEAVMNKYGKIGIIKGLYIFHLYRIWSDNIKDYKHLK